MTLAQKKGTLLIVDDTPANLELLSNILKTVGYGVRPAPSGRLALRAAQNDPPDLILLDITMPEMDGFEVCRRLKADDRLASIPVLFISALTDTADKITAFKAGGVDYITKPFQSEEVLARVDTHLQIRRYRDALMEKSQALEKTISNLKLAQDSLVQAEKMASLGVLTAGIAHEINNPINFVKTSAYALNQNMVDIQRLLDACDACSSKCQDVENKVHIADIKADISYDELVEEQPRLVKNITMGVERAASVIHSLRTYARPDGEKKSLVDLSELVDSALLLLDSRHKDIIRIRKTLSQLSPVPGQPGRLVQVFINVIGNAIDAVSGDDQEAQPEIEIRTDRQQHDNRAFAVMRVIDNGLGIKAAAVDKIFDPFFTTKGVGEGIGLGMSISYGIVRDHDGRIEVSSSENKGTTISIYLPMDGEAA